MNLYEEFKMLQEKEAVFEIKSEKYEDELFMFKYLSPLSDWTNELVRMARGIVVNKKGDIIIRPYEKFFNYKQYDWMLAEENISPGVAKLSNFETIDKIKDVTKMCHWQNADNVVVMDKLDGSLMTIGLYKDEILTTSSGSIDGVYPKYFKQLLEEKYNIEELKKDLLGKTFILEFIDATKDQHVVKYDFKDVVLHGVIYNETGLELTFEEVSKLAKKHGFKLPKIYNINTENEVLKLMSSLEGENVEGIVVAFEKKGQKTQRLKFKTESYKIKHGAFWTVNVDMFTFNSALYTFSLIVNGEIDDVLAGMELSDKSIEFLAILKDLEKEIIHSIHEAQELVNLNLTDKEIAMSNKSPLTKSIFFKKKNQLSTLETKDEFFEKYIKKSIKNIVNNFNSK